MLTFPTDNLCGLVTYETHYLVYASLWVYYDSPGSLDWCLIFSYLMIMAINGPSLWSWQPHFSVLMGLLCGATTVLSKLKLQRLIGVIINSDWRLIWDNLANEKGAWGGPALKDSFDVSKLATLPHEAAAALTVWYLRCSAFYSDYSSFERQCKLISQPCVSLALALVKNLYNWKHSNDMQIN